MESNKPRTVLVVEGEPSVHDIAGKMPKFTGFNVIQAIDTQSGLEQFKQNPDIDLVFFDVILSGGTSGTEIAKEMLAQKKHTPILIATGYSAKAGALVNKAPQSDNIGVVAKNKTPKLISAMISTAAAK